MLCVLMARADIGVSFSADPAGVSLGEASDKVCTPMSTDAPRVIIDHGGLRPTYVGPSI